VLERTKLAAPEAPQSLNDLQAGGIAQQAMISLYLNGGFTRAMANVTPVAITKVGYELELELMH